MKTSIIGFPRIGENRELKFAIEKYWRGEIDEHALFKVAHEIKQKGWEYSSQAGIDYIPSNDFSFYDHLLDTAVLFNIIPQRYRDLDLSNLDVYFAMARGYQGEKGDVKALAMKKWFNTNYHYMVPEIEQPSDISLQGTKIFDEYREAKEAGFETTPTLIGPFTLLSVSRVAPHKDDDVIAALVSAYKDFIMACNREGIAWVRFEEPSLVRDLDAKDIETFKTFYSEILGAKAEVKVCLQTYFGDIRDVYTDAVSLDFDAIGLDFIEGSQTFDTVFEHGFPKDKTLFAGIVNGKNIWKNNYQSSLYILDKLTSAGIDVVANTSCSLLHVPYALATETKFEESYRKHLAGAREKLSELADIATLAEKNTPARSADARFVANHEIFSERTNVVQKAVQQRVQDIRDTDFVRLPAFAERERIQKHVFDLPLFPTTTIGSFPQTKDVRENRKKFKQGDISLTDYENFNKEKISQCIQDQEEIGLDVIVHGEFERNDMVEYFGEHLSGFIFTDYAWVQSYGTRCVKPPIVWGDVARKEAITVKWSEFAQSCTSHIVKGMLTGPVTILNWSFPREDISIKDQTLQIALAIRDEVLDLEAHGIRIIQIDEAALREKLPLRKSDWFSGYLDWAIPAFRLVHSGVAPETQIHTHMCYSEFSDIIGAIDDMDADVITFEASRSDLSILGALQKNNFKTQVGPGVYDIHSPRVPSEEEICAAIERMLEKVPQEKLWINPDCGLKTRGEQETKLALENLVHAAQKMRTQQGCSTS